jgi:hypothetical protein
VLLELELSAAGEVVGSRIVAGEEPFASAAREASLAWRFHPTTRAGRAIRSRIRFEIVFPPLARLEPEPAPVRAPEPPRPAAPSAQAPGTDVPAAPRAEAETEVVVEG